MIQRHIISHAVPNMIRGLVIACAVAGSSLAHARVDMVCTHVTKSTLMQTPLARPLFEPADAARVSVEEDGTISLRVRNQTVVARQRICPRGGATTCTDVRRTDGDVVSFYQDITKAKGRVFAIWGRKGDRAQDLIENVVLQCCVAGGDC